MKSKTKRITKNITVITTIVLVAVSTWAFAQDRGILGFDPETDSGFVRLIGTTGNNSSRLWVAAGGDDNRGILQLYDNGADRVRLMVDSAGQGHLVLDGSDSTKRALLGVFNGSDNGVLQLYNSDAEIRAQLAVDSAEQGELRIFDSDGGESAVLYVDDATDAGALRLHEANGEPRALLSVDVATQGDLALGDVDSIVKAQVGLDDAENNGFVELRGQRGGRIVTASSFAPSMPNDGALRVYGFDEADGELRGELYGDPVSEGGNLTLYNSDGNPTIVLDGATGVISKSGMNGFLIRHPKDQSREIFYASLEGPEAGIYARGTARLVGGHAIVKLPEHFALVAHPEGMTVQVTPNSADTYGLAVLEKSRNAFVVQELAGGTGNFGFDYTVSAARGDIPAFDPVRSRKTPADFSEARSASRAGRLRTRSVVIEELSEEGEAEIEGEEELESEGRVDLAASQQEADEDEDKDDTGFDSATEAEEMDTGSNVFESEPLDTEEE